MLSDLFFIERIKIENAPRLFPKGIDWKIRPGINVIVGGTGLGKTTLVNAMLFGIFGDFGRSTNWGTGKKIDKEFFLGRMADTSTEADETLKPTVSVRAKFGSASVKVARNLVNGKLIKATLNGGIAKRKEYEADLANALGLGDFASQLLHLVDNLLYFGEHRYLLSWDSKTQNEIIRLFSSEPEAFQEVNKIWKDAMSADSEFRNLRYQAGEIEKEVEALEPEREETRKESLGTQRAELEKARISAYIHRDKIREKYQKEIDHIEGLDHEISLLQQNYNSLAEPISEEQETDLDLTLLTHELETPSAQSIYYAIRQLTSPAGEWLCPCCGRKVDVKKLPSHLRSTAKLMNSGACPICSSTLSKLHTKNRRHRKSLEGHLLQIQKELRGVTEELQSKILDQEKTKSRLRVMKDELERAEKNLEIARDSELKFNIEHPELIDEGYDSRKIALEQLRLKQKRAEERRDRLVAQFEAIRDEKMEIFNKLYNEIAAKFSSYSRLFLDEPCSVELDLTGDRARRSGPQLDPRHSAFYPIIDGVPRYRPGDLSDAQGLFVDLAFRMTLLDIWGSRNNKPATMIIETPEGSVDVAYMVRVAEMLREFTSKGHTLIVTTNLNNEEFLPSLMKEVPATKRPSRILNLLEFGLPKPVQVEHAQKFKRILNKALKDK